MAEIRLFDIQKDYVFKRVFGIEKNKKSLISLLNAILKGEPKIEDIELLNSEVPKIFEDNKNIRLDVRARIGHGLFADIEIQSQNTGEIPERSIQNLANMMSEHTLEGTPESRKNLESDLRSYKYPKIIGIWILGENVTRRKGAIHESCMTCLPTSVDDYEIMTDKMRVIFIELRKAHPRDLTRRNMLDMWLAFLKNPLNAKEAEPVEEVQQAFETLKYLSADAEFRNLARYIENARKEQEVKERIAVEKALEEGKIEGFEKGEKIGIEKGKAEGEKIGIEKERAKALEEKHESARTALSMGLSIEQVSKITGLSIESIRILE